MEKQNTYILIIKYNIGMCTGWNFECSYRVYDIQYKYNGAMDQIYFKFLQADVKKQTFCECSFKVLVKRK